MAFDWEAFFNRYRIDYSDSGPSTAKGNLYIHCPMCGDADKGKHMGVSTKGNGWGCWRNAAHRGKSIPRLISALLGCPWTEALQIAGQKKGLSGGARGLLAGVKSALSGGQGRPLAGALSMPGHFRPLKKGTPSWAAIRDRGFASEEIRWLVPAFDLRVSNRDGWHYRIIFPVRDEKGKLQTWTGRAIGAHPIRYKTLALSDEGKPGFALSAINDHFLRKEKLLDGGRFLILVEGPFDCMRVALEESEFDAVATCLFGKTLSPAQAEFLLRIKDRYDRIVLVLDKDAAMDTIRLQARYRFLEMEVYRLESSKDPGDMSAKEIRTMLADIGNRISKDRK